MNAPMKFNAPQKRGYRDTPEYMGGGAFDCISYEKCLDRFAKLENKTQQPVFRDCPKCKEYYPIEIRNTEQDILGSAALLCAIMFEEKTYVRG